MQPSSRASFPVLFLASVATAVGLSQPAAAGDAAEQAGSYHPWVQPPSGPLPIDLSAEGLRRSKLIDGPVEQPQFHRLDEFRREADDQPDTAERPDVPMPQGWVQRGNVVLPRAVAEGEIEVDPNPTGAPADWPGNKYPRKHTLFLNFNGGKLDGGGENSAENISSLARYEVYPSYTGGEAKALAAIQAIENDMAPFGIRVLYLERPNKTVPYTMAMIGGQWQDTTLDEPAAGVAPGADCGALGQRHVVYVFATAGWGATSIANTTAQEAGHAWGLDHSFNCDSVMSYCGGANDRVFSDTCDGLCEQQCQGLASCRVTHDMFCGEGSDQQNELAELQWLFGSNEPDLEPPTVEIVEPAQEVVEYEAGDQTILVRAKIDDNYGGFGWKIMITRDGEVVHDAVDYDKKTLDDDLLSAIRLQNPEPGEYEVTFEAEDQADHITKDSIVIRIGDPAPTTTGGDGSSGDGTSGGDGGSTSGGDSVGGDGNDGGDSEGDTEEEPSASDGGGGCSIAGRGRFGGAAWAWLGLLVVGLRMRGWRSAH